VTRGLAGCRAIVREAGAGAVAVAVVAVGARVAVVAGLAVGLGDVAAVPGGVADRVFRVARPGVGAVGVERALGRELHALLLFAHVVRGALQRVGAELSALARHAADEAAGAVEVGRAVAVHALGLGAARARGRYEEDDYRARHPDSVPA